MVNKTIEQNNEMFNYLIILDELDYNNKMKEEDFLVQEAFDVWDTDKCLNNNMEEML